MEVALVIEVGTEVGHARRQGVFLDQPYLWGLSAVAGSSNTQSVITVLPRAWPEITQVRS